MTFFYLSAFVANPFRFVEMDCVHVVLEIGTVGERLLAQRTFWHELAVAVGVVD